MSDSETTPGTSSGQPGPGDDSASTQPGPGAGTSRKERWGAALRRHSTHTLVVGVVAALVGALAPQVAGGLWDGLFEKKPAGCPGAGCDGKSAQAHGCSGSTSRTFNGKRPNPVKLQIRYSPRCGAVWGRIINGEVGDKVMTEVQGGGTREAVIQTHHDQFTMMVAVGKTFQVKVCAVPTVGVKRSGEWKDYCISGTDKDFPAPS